MKAISVSTITIPLKLSNLNMVNFQKKFEKSFLVLPKVQPMGIFTDVPCQSTSGKSVRFLMSALPLVRNLRVLKREETPDMGDKFCIKRLCIM